LRFFPFSLISNFSRVSLPFLSTPFPFLRNAPFGQSVPQTSRSFICSPPPSFFYLRCRIGTIIPKICVLYGFLGFPVSMKSSLPHPIPFFRKEGDHSPRLLSLRAGAGNQNPSVYRFKKLLSRSVTQSPSFLDPLSVPRSLE